MNTTTKTTKLTKNQIAALTVLAAQTDPISTGAVRLWTQHDDAIATLNGTQTRGALNGLADRLLVSCAGDDVYFWQVTDAGRAALVAASIEADAAPVVDETRGECQICGRSMKIGGPGVLSMHGYSRPGDGWLHGQCAGAHRLPYPATDALADYGCSLVAYRVGQATRLAELQSGEFEFVNATVTVRTPGSWKSEQVARRVTRSDFTDHDRKSELFSGRPSLTFETLVQDELRKVGSLIRRVDFEVERVDARIAAAAALA